VTADHILKFMISAQVCGVRPALDALAVEKDIPLHAHTRCGLEALFT
jgi:hypothetical protein